MIEYTTEQREELRSLITRRAPAYGFDIAGDDLIPTNISKTKQDVRINMFLAIGINSTARCKSFIAVRDFINKGINRFFRSLRNRTKLNASTLINNDYEGRDLLCADFYIGPSCFGLDIVPDNVLDEWNVMMRNIRVANKHGIKVVRIISPKDSITVKYQWYDRQTRK